MDILSWLDAPVWLCLLIAVLMLIYLYASWPFSIWSSLGVPGPRPLPFLGNTRELLKKTTYVAYAEWEKTYGPIFGMYSGRCPILVVNDLDILKEVLVKDFSNFADRHFNVGTMRPPTIDCGLFFANGTAWKRIRTLMTPTFSASKLKNMCRFIDRCSRVLVESLQTKAEKDEAIDVKLVFSSFTMDVIAGTAFGLETNSQTQEDEPFVTNCRQLMRKINKPSKPMLVTAVFPFLKPIFRALNLVSFTDVEADFLVESVYKMVDERKADSARNGQKRTDLLQLLVDAEMDPSELAEDRVKTSDGTGIHKRLTRQEIVGQGFVVLLAGFDTTSTTLQYLTYNLTMHPDSQQRVYDEIRDVIGDADPSYENVGGLKFLDAAIHETLRLFPPLPFINRKARKTTIIKGVTIPAGCGVGIPIYQIMHDSRYFQDPDTFIPERFLGDRRSELHPMLVELVFGYGPRQCIGMRLALLEIKFAAVRIFRHFRFLKCDETPIISNRYTHVNGNTEDANRTMGKEWGSGRDIANNRAWRVVLDAGFLRVCPIQPHFLRRICLATGSCPARSHSSSFRIFSGHRMLKMRLRQLTSSGSASVMTFKRNLKTHLFSQF
nr:hypothetical protein BaRGS_023943 [Batillaria attramentaria]